MKEKLHRFTSLLRGTICQFWPIWLAYLVVLILFCSLSPLRFSESIGYRMQDHILDNASLWGIWLPCIAAPMAAIAVFSHQFVKGSTVAFAALPLRRKAMYLSSMLAGLLPLLAAAAVAFVIYAAMVWSTGAVQWQALLLWLGIVALNTVTFYGFAVLCTQLTGRITAAAALYLLFTVVTPAMEFFLSLFLSSFYKGWSGVAIGPILQRLDPIIYLNAKLTTSGAGVIYNGIPRGLRAAGSCALVGLGLLSVSGVLYKLRPTEAVGELSVFRILRPVLRCIPAVICACIGLLFSPIQGDLYDAPMHSDVMICIACLLGGGLVGYCIGALLEERSLRIFRRARTWLCFGIFSAIAALVFCVVAYDLTGYETYIPDPDQVDSVTLIYQEYGTYREPELIRGAMEVHRTLLERGIGESVGFFENSDFSVTYKLKNGLRVERKYWFGDGNAGDDAVLKQAAEAFYNFAAACESP